MPVEEQLLKIVLHNCGEDVETVWAFDLGPANGTTGARRVRLDNVPFLHAKPTVEDEIIVEPGEDGRLSWDKKDDPYERVCERIVKDSGRWIMIIDYKGSDPSEGQEIYTAMRLAVEPLNVITEGAFAPRHDSPGQAYFAIPSSVTLDSVMALVQAAVPNVEVHLAHPLPD